MGQVLRDGAPADGGGGNPPAPAAAPATATAADVAAGKKTAREIQLEKKVSVLEDEKKSLTDQLAEATGFIEKTKKLPSARHFGKSILDEINSALSLPFADPTENPDGKS